MPQNKMITSAISVQIAESVEAAPKYSEEFKMVRADTVVIVPNGTKEGNPTVDIQLVDEEGNKYLIMATGKIMEMIGQMVSTSRRQTNTG